MGKPRRFLSSGIVTCYGRALLKSIG